MKTLALLGAKKSVTKKIIRENEKITNKRNDKHKDADSLSLLHNTGSRSLCLYDSPEAALAKHFIGENEKWTNKGIRMRMLILSYTIQQVIPNVCTKFQNPRCSSF